jgi:hypothetical protein
MIAKGELVQVIDLPFNVAVVEVVGKDAKTGDGLALISFIDSGQSEWYDVDELEGITDHYAKLQSLLQQHADSIPTLQRLLAVGLPLSTEALSLLRQLIDAVAELVKEEA